MLGEFLNGDRVRRLVVAAQRAPSWLRVDPVAFQRDYNRKPFVVHHRLPDHPKFQLDALRALCHRLPRSQVRHRFGEIPKDVEFDSSLEKYAGGLTFEDAVDRLEEKRAYIAIYNAERDPEYAPVIEGLLGELAVHIEGIEPGLNWYSTYIFISTQDAVTPYHMDREMNFLLQIRGTKTVRLWDPRDDEVMTPAERDRLLSLRSEPRPTYKDALDRKAMVFELAPGLGVHHPFIAPHLVYTKSELSISLAITFRTTQSDRWTDAHRFNQLFARRLGITPRVVGESPLVDHGKARVYRAVRRARDTLRLRRWR